MIDAKRRPWVRYGCACLLMAGTMAAAAYVPGAWADQAVPEAPEAAAAAVNPVIDGIPMVPSTDKTVVGSTGAWENADGIRLPQVDLLADGTLVQLAPSLSGVGNGSAQAVLGSTNYAGFNTEYLEADDRGCASCHDDLGAMVDGIGWHLIVDHGLNVETGYEQCTTCHWKDGVRNDLGTILHRKHQGIAECYDCHSEADGEGNFPIWDIDRYGELRGIASVPNVEGEFTWDQETITAHDEIFNAGWLGNENAQRRYDDIYNREPVDEETFNTWAITVTGAVGEEMTWSLPELIEQAPSVTQTMKIHCDVNPIGGSMIAQAVVTGIPVSWLLEQTGLTDDAAAVRFIDINGGGTGNSGALNLHEFDEQGALLVYEINGERLNWSDGYPVQVWVNEDFAARYRKQVAEIRVETNPILDEVPQAEGASRGYDKPNVGIVNMVEGQCFQAGEPITFEGYADAFEQHISAVEFSMDGGNTWTTCYTPGADATRWVYWHFTWTPPADVNNAYHLQVRAKTDEGRYTPVPLDYMFNTKADLEQFTADVMAQIESE